MIGCTKKSDDYLDFLRYMTLPAIWAIYSLSLVWIGLKRTLWPVVHCSLAALGLAVLWAVVRGAAFEPIEKYALIWNARLGIMVFVSLALFAYIIWLNKNTSDKKWIKQAAIILKVVIVLFMLELITVETIDRFSKAIADLTNSRTAGLDIQKESERLRDLRQLYLSVGWLVYSIILMGIGIWRRMQWLRIMAIGLFGITILKIFIYDLSFLETLYRIFSFIGLGLMLLLVSYLYQRFKSVIFDTPSDKPGNPS